MDNKDIKNPLREVEVLKYALRNLWSMRKLSQEYSSLLKENISDENYEKVMDSYTKIAKNYAFTPRNLPPEEIAYSAKLILDTIDEELGSDDIADLLELDVMNVENVLTQYSQK